MTGDDRRVPSPLTSLLVIVAITWRRVFRGRAVWVSAAIALLPIAYALAARGTETKLTSDLLAFELLLLVILPPMFVASSIGEEIEERTTTYLWSRPLPRWTILAGKLVALAPIPIVFVLASWFVASFLVGAPPTLASSVALAACGIAIACVAAGIATLVPKHGLALTVSYFLFFDLPIGILPASLRHLSITHHARVIGGLTPTQDNDNPFAGTRLAAVAIDHLATSSIVMMVIALVWATIGFLRIRRLEV